MHDIVIDELETHLSGGVLKPASRAFYEHLDACPPCRAEVAEMDSLSLLLRGMRPAEDAVTQPSLGFYNRVRYRIVENQRKEAWGLFAPGAVFFRRIAFASLLLLAGLGSFLVSRESSFSGADAAAIMAQHDPVADHSDADRDRLLLTLADYHE
jgi:anti-sigma factor RsiW